MCWRSARPEDRLVRVELFGDEVEVIRVDPTTGEILQSMMQNIYPAKHFVTPKDRLDTVIVRHPLRAGAAGCGRPTAKASCWKPSGWSSALSTTWRCWARWATATGWRTTPAIGWREGTPPECLIDYFPDDWLLIVDESHVTCSQLQAYNGDQARKQVPIEHGSPAQCGGQPAAQGRRVLEKGARRCSSLPPAATGRWR